MVDTVHNRLKRLFYLYGGVQQTPHMIFSKVVIAALAGIKPFAGRTTRLYQLLQQTPSIIKATNNSLAFETFLVDPNRQRRQLTRRTLLCLIPQHSHQCCRSRIVRLTICVH